MMRGNPKSRPVLVTIAALAVCLAACSPEKPDTDAGKRDRIEKMYGEFQSEFSEAPDIGPDDLARWRDREPGLVVVDVRTPEEQRVSTIPGAITAGEFSERHAEIGDSPVVAYCTIGYRSGLFTAEQAAAGFNIYNLRGSILGWVHAGQPVVDPEGNPTNRVHVYGPDWNLLPEGYDSIW